MPRGIAVALADKFVNDSAFAAQLRLSGSVKITPAMRLKQLREVDKRCHALVQSLNNLSAECVRELGDAAIRLRGPSSATPGLRLATMRLGELWDAARDLEAMAELAIERRPKLGRGDRLSVGAAKELAHGVALAHFEVFGKWPSIGDTWFHRFVEVLGTALGLKCGAKLVNGVLKGRPVPISVARVGK